MPLINLRFEHGQTLEEASRRLERTVDQASRQFAPNSNYRANNWERPGNTGANTDGQTLGNFGAGSGRPEIFGGRFLGISWHGHEIGPSGSPVFAPDIDPTLRYYTCYWVKP